MQIVEEYKASLNEIIRNKIICWETGKIMFEWQYIFGKKKNKKAKNAIN